MLAPDPDPTQQNISLTCACSEAAAKLVTVKVGSDLRSNRHLVERYGSDTLASLACSFIIPESLLKRVPQLLDLAVKVKPVREAVKAEPLIKPEDPEAEEKTKASSAPPPSSTTPVPEAARAPTAATTKVINLPDTLPQVFTELLRWLECKKMTPQHFDSTKQWPSYYAPLAPEDVALGSCTFASHHALKAFHNCAIDMLGYYHSLTPFSAISLARRSAAANGARAPVTKMLVMCAVLTDVKGKGAGFDVGKAGFEGCPELMGVYMEQFFKVTMGGKNRGKAMSKANQFEYAPLRDYYL